MGSTVWGLDSLLLRECKWEILSDSQLLHIGVGPVCFISLPFLSALMFLCIFSYRTSVYIYLWRVAWVSHWHTFLTSRYHLWTISTHPRVKRNLVTFCLLSKVTKWPSSETQWLLNMAEERYKEELTTVRNFPKTKCCLCFHTRKYWFILFLKL